MKTTIKIHVEAENQNQRRDAISHAIQSAVHMGHVQKVQRDDEKGQATITLFSEDRDSSEYGALAANSTF